MNTTKTQAITAKTDQAPGAVELLMDAIVGAIDRNVPDPKQREAIRRDITLGLKRAQEQLRRRKAAH